MKGIDMKQYTLLPLDNLNVLMEKSGSVAIDFDGNLYVSHTNGIVMVPGEELAAKPGFTFKDMSNDDIMEFVTNNVAPPSRSRPSPHKGFGFSPAKFPRRVSRRKQSM